MTSEDRGTPTRPYGSWPTPITSARIVESAARLGEVLIAADGAIWWSESRPSEGGRSVLVRRSADGEVADRVPAGFNARTRVHEYGGAAWWLADPQTVYAADFADQRLYRLAGEDQVATAVTAEGQPAAGLRYADGRVSADGSMTCVRERHDPDGTVHNEIVALPAPADGDPVEAQVLVGGPDFVSDPRWSPDGSSLSWLQWDHPSMPWDGTELVVRTGVGDGRAVEHRVAGGERESVLQPTWTAAGDLLFISDRTGWWNLYRWHPETDEVTTVLETDVEIGTPPWVFGSSRYAELPDGRIVAALGRDGFDELVVLDGDQEPRRLDLPYAVFDQLRAHPSLGSRFACVVAGPAHEPAVVLIDADDGSVQRCSRPRDLGVDPAYWSMPEPVRFPTTGGREAHALVYPPTNPAAQADPGDRPPLLVMIHGGPTAMTTPALRLGIQYWTSRGFTVADVNYGGSTGFGRAYRDRLKGNWGVVDLDDCVACAQHLADEGRVDPDRMAITGGSAGGYTVLAVHAFRPGVFSAGASHYGVADMSLLAEHTHKFEARYLDQLVGPYPAAKDVYDARSPAMHAALLSTPLAVFQGLEDAVVPPEQAELIVDALTANRVPHAAVFFPGEQHGFRIADNIRAALDGELSFYAQTFGFDLPPEEGIAPIEIRNGDGADAA